MPVNKALPITSPPLQSGGSSEQDIISQLRAIRFADTKSRIGQTSPGIKTIADAAGLSKQTVYTIIETGQCSPLQRRSLAQAYAAVQNRRYKNPRPPQS